MNEIDTLLLRYEQGTANKDEQAEVERWLAQSDENKTYYNQMQFIMHQTTTPPNAIDVDVDAAWISVQQKIQFSENKPSDTVVRRLHVSVFKITSIAAAVAILLAAGIWISLRNQTNKTAEFEQIASTNKSIDKQLNDGTKLLLSKNTNLRYSAQFGRTNRKVELDGEARFDVQHNDSMPFTVVTQGLTITDIGTIFTVNSRTSDSVVSISVSEGIVDVQIPQGQSIRLQKGDAAVYNKRSQQLQITTSRTDNDLDNSHIFTFQDTPMSEVIAQLEAVYHQDIELAKPKMNNCRISVEFRNESLEAILTIVCETLQFKLQKTNKGFRLEGEGCEKQ